MKAADRTNQKSETRDQKAELAGQGRRLFLTLPELLMVKRLIERSDLRWSPHMAWAEAAAGEEWQSGHNDDTRAALVLARVNRMLASAGAAVTSRDERDRRRTGRGH